MNTFEINGVVYTARPLDFNAVCDLEELGIAVDDFGKKQLTLARCYLALCSDMDIEDAGIEIQNHIINGGKVEGLFTAFSKEVENSDFFRKLFQTTEENVAESESEKAKTTKKVTTSKK